MNYSEKYKEFSELWYYCNNNTTADTKHHIYNLQSVYRTDMSVSSASYKRRYSNQKSTIDLINSESMYHNKSKSMPSPTGTPWDVHSMPWSSGTSKPQIMEFNAQPWGSFAGTFANRTSSKRKSEGETFVPRKQLITDEKMAAHFNSLHISGSVLSTTENQNDVDLKSDSTETMEADINMDLDLESKLKSAQKIILSEEMKKIATDSILPQSLLQRLETPCKAVVLWQPQPKTSLHPTANQSNTNDEDDVTKNKGASDINPVPSTSGIHSRSRGLLNFMDDDQQNNNNSGHEMDLNSTTFDMDM